MQSVRECDLEEARTLGAIEDAYRMTFAEGTNVKESKCLVAFEELERRDLAWS